MQTCYILCKMHGLGTDKCAVLADLKIIVSLKNLCDNGQ